MRAARADARSDSIDENGPEMLDAVRRQRGFTLLEVMVVVVILGILAALVVPKIIGRPDEARVIAARQDIASLMQALKLYRLDNQRYPTTEQGLQAKVAPELVGMDSPLFSVEGTTSIVQFETDVLGLLSVVESNPGPDTTAYGLLADFINAVKP